jgi:hypothetical protein
MLLEDMTALANAVVLGQLCGALGITLSEIFPREVPSPLLQRAGQPVWHDPSSGYLRREVAPAETDSPARIGEVEFPSDTELSFEPSLSQRRKTCVQAWSNCWSTRAALCAAQLDQDRRDFGLLGQCQQLFPKAS